MAYFFDASAIIEFINDEKIEEKYIDEKIITNALHMGEVYFYFLKEHGKKTADFWISKLEVEIIDIDIGVSVEAALFKFEHKKKNFSYADCIGYISALRFGLRFLTKDKWFEDFDSVEFVK